MPYRDHRWFPECTGQIEFVCRTCEGQRILVSADTPAEPCPDCAATGIDCEQFG